MKPTRSLLQRLFLIIACCCIPRILIASEVEDSQRYDVYAFHAQVHVDYMNGGGHNHYQQEGLRYLDTFQAGDLNMDSLSIHLNGFSPNIVHREATNPPNENGHPCINSNVVDEVTGEVFVYDSHNLTFTEDRTLEGSESSVLLIGDDVKTIGANCLIANNSFTRFRFFVLARPVGQEGPTPESDLEEYLPDGTNLYGIEYRDVEYMLSQLFPPGSYRISDPGGDGYPGVEDWRRLYPPPPGYPYDEGDPEGHNPPGGGGGGCNTCDDSCLAEAGAENGSLRVTVPIRDGVEVTVESDTMQTDYYATNLLKLPKSLQYAYVYESLPTGRISEIYTGTELCTFDVHGTGGLTIEVHEVADGSAPDGSGSYRYLIAPGDSSLRYAAELDVQNGGSTVEVKLDTVLPYAKTRYKRFTYLTNLEGTTGKNGWLFSHLSADQTTTLQAHLKTVYDSTAGGVVYQTITERLVDPLHPTDTTKYASFVEKKYRKYLLGSEEHWLLVESTSGLGALAETILYDYEDAGVNRGKLISARYPDGNWERFEYDGLGRRTKYIRSYLGNDWSNNSEAANRVTEYDYTVTQPDDTGLQLRKARTVTEKVQGAVISKTFTVVGNGFERTEQAGSATAAVGDAANLVTTTYTDRLRTVTELPDGRIRTREITNQVDFEFTTTAIGVPGAGPYAAPIDQEVGEGDVTVVERDLTEDRRVRSSKRYWRQPGTTHDLLLTGSTSTFGNDGIGDPRASRMDYEDGTYTERTYSCCGLLSQTDKNGITTTYSHDDMERVIRTSRSGVTSHTEYDFGGRVHRTARTPETIKTLAEVEAGSPADVIGLTVSEYDILGRQTRQIDPAGRETQYSRQALNGIITRTMILPGGSTRIETHYADGTPIETLGTAARHMTTSIHWDANGQRITEQAYTTNTNEFTRTTADFLGRTVKTERPSPTGTGLATTTQEYEAGTGRLLSSTNADGIETLYLYNAEGEQVSTILDVDGDEIIDYAGMDRITTNAVEVVSTSTLPTELLSLTNQYSHVRQTRTWSYTQDNTDSTTLLSESWSTFDGLRSWNRSFGNFSSSKTVRDAANQTLTRTQTTADGSYTVSLSISNRTDTVTHYQADGTQLAKQTYSYDAWNRTSTVTDAGTGDTTTTYHVDGSVHTVTNTLNQVTATVSSGLNGQAYAPDGGRIQTVTAHDGGVVTRTYNALGQLVRQEGARTYTSEYTYDYAGRMIKLVTWRDKVSGPGQETQWVYNDAGMLITKIYDDDTQIRYTYDVAGRLKTRTWARGELTTYHYDALGQLITVDYADVDTPDVTQSYDRLGRMTSITDGSGTRSYSYDPTHLGLIQEEYTAGLHAGRKLEREYDALERPEQVTLLQGTNTLHQVAYGYEAGSSRLHTVQGHAVRNRYAYVQNRPVLDTLEQRAISGGTLLRRSDWIRDAGNRMENIHNSLSSTNQVISTYAYAYTDANKVDTITLKDGTWWDYGYDDKGQVTSGERKGLNSGTPTTLPSYNFGYAFDDIGNRISATEGTITTQYQANALNQYSQITYPDAKYLRGEVAVGTTSIELNKQPATDTAGFNLLLWSSLQGLVSNENDFYITATEGAGPPKVEKRLALSPTGTLAPSYDLDGNLLQDALWDYEWNAENRLVKQTHRADLTLDQLERVQLEFVYDSQGRRVKKAVSTWNGSSFVPASETLFLYDGWNLVAEIDSSSQSVVRSYTWGMDLSGSLQGAGGVGGLLSVEKGADVFLPSYDHNGNITAYSDASGSIVAEFEYDPFGRLLRETGDHVEDVVHRFSTKYQDQESGYYYYGFRYYDSETGRWLNRDPIEEQGGYNIYGFVGNGGVNGYDYLGMLGNVDCDTPCEEQCRGQRGTCIRRCRNRQRAAFCHRHRLIQSCLDGFCVVGSTMEINGGDTLQQIGFVHVDIHYNGWLVYTGEGGGTGRAGRNLEDPQFFHTYRYMVKLNFRTRGEFQWGDAAGCPCKTHATDESIISCLAAKQLTPGCRNCQGDVLDATQECCLSGFINPIAFFSQGSNRLHRN